MLHTKRSRAMSPNTSNKLFCMGGPLDANKENVDPGIPGSIAGDIASLQLEEAVEEAKASPFEILKGLVVEVEGNVGSGKSTLLKRIRTEIGSKAPEDTCNVFDEKVNNDFLGAFYSDTKKYGFAFQMYMLTTRLYQMDEASRLAKNENKISFLDRGAVGDTLFAILSHRLGNMDQQDYEVYKSVCRERMPESLSSKVDLFLYLDVDPAECHRRVTTVRGNEAESGVPLAYVEAVDACYFELIVRWLGGKQSEHHTMNAGKCPPFACIRWHKFGEAAHVLEELERLQAGTRRQPTVVFQSQPPTLDQTHEQPAWLATAEHAATLHKALLEHDTLPLPEHAVHVNWSLPHSNAFRRVVMFLLSVGADIVFYGPDAPEITGSQL